MKWLARAWTILGSIAEALLNSNDSKHIMTNREILFHAALNHCGTDASPDDDANDAYGCVDSIEEIHHKIFGEYIGAKKTLSTYWLKKYLDESPKFIRVPSPQEGSIVLSPTGYGGKNGVKNGHVGIVGAGGVIMSNDSRTGLWDENYTVDSWHRYYATKGGYPVYFYNRI